MQLDLNRLKAERIANNLTQEDVGKHFKKTRAWYAKRECGIVPLGADDLAELATLYKVKDISIFFTLSVPEKEQN